MRLGVIAGMGSDWQTSLEKVRIAEDLGYELVTSGESWGPSVLPWLSLLAANTSKIQIGPSILNCFSRSPAVMAQEFASLDQISGGRMIFGIGSSGNLVIEGYHGVPFERPLRRMREYIEIFNILIGGGRLKYEGEIFQLERGFSIDYDRPRDSIPVYIAAITPRSIEQTGEIADGIFPIHWPRGSFETLREQLAVGAARADRSADAITIAPFTNTYDLDGQDDEQQWRAARQPLFHYINRMGSFYWQMLSHNGFEAEVAASREAWKERDMEGAFDALSEEMVREIQVIGPADSVREQLQERAALGADLQMISMPEGPPAEAGAHLEALLA